LTDYFATLATSDRDREEAFALRYSVFVEELGAQAPTDVASQKQERDKFDAHCDHMLVRDRGSAGLLPSTAC